MERIMVENDTSLAVEPLATAFGRLMRALCPLVSEAWLETELTMAQLKTLSLLHARGRASGREVAHALGVGASAVSQLVDRLVGEGYVERAEDCEDRRITWLVPTARGRDAIEQMVGTRREGFAALAAALSEPERAQVTAALNLLADAAERASAVGRPAEGAAADKSSGRSHTGHRPAASPTATA
jgi:DNA-binding MarR family transcriptional regulator